MIKSAAPELRDEYDSLAEKILDYFETVNEFDRKKLFFLVNMRSYVSDEEMDEFASNALSHGYLFLLIDNVEHGLLNKEKRVIIDKDLCEIY